jgi:hypothetical protein
MATLSLLVLRALKRVDQGLVCQELSLQTHTSSGEEDSFLENRGDLFLLTIWINYELRNMYV